MVFMALFERSEKKHHRVRFVPLGGITGVTKNMYVYELYEGNTLTDILIVDCGIGFSKEKELGVDFVIPDISYLKDKRDKIRAVVFTHGHEDHITALRFHFEALGKPPLYASTLTASLIEEKAKEFGLGISVNRITYRKKYTLGSFGVEFLELTHSIPDTTHIVITTPLGVFYHGSDFKFDLTPPYGNPPDLYGIAQAGERGVLCLLSDCLGAENKGFTESEKIVGNTFDEEMKKTKGAFYMTTFSSNISRIHQCIETAIKYNRKICFIGRSMKTNTLLAQRIKYLPIPHKQLAKEEDLQRYAPSKLCIIIAGSQGQYDSALSKLANRENPHISVKRGDRVVFSSDPIPGYENEVYDLIEGLSRAGASVVYSDIHGELHASGHGNQEDLKLLMRLTKPRCLIPIGGTVRHQLQYLELAKEIGHGEKDVFLLDETDTVWFERGKTYRGDKVPSKNIFVDAYGVGDVGNVVLRDRQTLSQEGMVAVVLILDAEYRTITAPQYISYGFIGKADRQGIFSKSENVIGKILERRKHEGLESMRSFMIKELETFFCRETGRKPLVAVEIIQV